jgi:SAM-dependent methyltransferase
VTHYRIANPPPKGRKRRTPPVVGVNAHARLRLMVTTFWTDLTRHIRGRIGRRRAFNSLTYWQERYAKGGNSGAGSYGRLALFKAEVINTFVEDNAVESVIEFGCGDGNQLSLYKLPRYAGLDVSPHTIGKCQERFADDPSKRFHLRDSEQLRADPAAFRADLALSIDVLFHLTEDAVFERYMRDVFAAGTKFVIIYSSDTDRNSWFQPKHVKHRKFTDWVEVNAADWTLDKIVRNKYPLKKDDKIESLADFFIYRKGPASGSAYVTD